MKNWFGIEPHITDSYIHWSVKDKDKIPKATKLRAAYDKLAEVDKKALDYLLSEAWEEGNDAGYETGVAECPEHY